MDPPATSHAAPGPRQYAPEPAATACCHSPSGARHNVCTVRVQRKGLSGNALPFQHLSEMINRLCLVARRAAGINANQHLVAIENFSFLFYEIDVSNLRHRLKK